MAPRRSVKISPPEKEAQITSEKFNKRQSKRAKPLKVPAVITITIPSKINNLDVPDSLKRVDKSTKIALADQVARSQILNEPIPEKVADTPTPVNKRGRKPKVVSQFFNNTNETVNTTKTTPVTVTRNAAKKTAARTPQVASKPTVRTRNETRKRAAESIQQKHGMKRQKMAPKELTIKKEATVKEDKTQENDPGEKSPVFTTPLVTPALRRLRLIRGKQDNVTTRKKTLLPKTCSQPPQPEATDDKSPNSQSEDIDQFQPTGSQSPKPRSRCFQSPKLNKSSKNEKVSVNNVVPVDSRKTSVSSNLSWTRDISSSSTTTCTTVSSKDFVRFDKKIPMIKLTNVDNEIEKYKQKPDSDDNTDSSEDSTSDSETSSDQSSDATPSLPTYPSFVKANTLNLSSPSRCSQDVEPDSNKQDSNKKDFGRAAENLMHALKKIDIELINWIHETDYVSSNLNRIKDKLFDILNNEFCAMSHCRKLQEINDLDVSIDTNVDIFLETDENKKLDSNKNDEPDSRVEVNHVQDNRTEDTIVLSNSTNNNNIENITGKPNTIENNTLESAQFNSNNNSTKIIRVESNPVNSSRIENNAVNNKDDTSRMSNGGDINLSKKANDKVKNSPKVANSFECNKDDIRSSPEKLSQENEFLKPSTSGIISNKFNSSIQESLANDKSESDDYTSDFDDSLNVHDDDDALSLFAESITGIESSKPNTSNVSASMPLEKQIEEYVPTPVQKTFISPTNYTYRPTRIPELLKNGVAKPVCEKQNADSTSIYKDSNSNPPVVFTSKSSNSNTAVSVESNQEIKNCDEYLYERYIPNNTKEPRLMANLYEIRPKAVNNIFKGYCYFNLAYRCSSAKFTNNPCRFRHEIPSEEEVQEKLSKINEQSFILEYMLLRRNTRLLRKFAMCFVRECLRRQLTRIIVEISLDIITKCVNGAELNDKLLILAVETTLLHLNNVDLSVCEDILRIEVKEGILLCDVFMQIMTCSQNFSRFKSVFLSLTYFMVNNDRTFNLDVAEQILERVCILQFDESLVRALMQIMRLTDPDILRNSMIEHFEKLINTKSDIWEMYMSIKYDLNLEKLARQVAIQTPVGLPVEQSLLQTVNQPQLMQQVPPTLLLQPVTQPALLQPVTQPALGQPVTQPALLQSVTQPALLQAVPKPALLQTFEQPITRSEMREGVPLPPSPDTTHLDNMNKAFDEPKVPTITRTIRTGNAALEPQISKNQSSSNSEDIEQTPHHQNWRYKSIFQQIKQSYFSPRGSKGPPRRSLRPPGGPTRNQFGQRLVTFGGIPVKFPPPGQDDLQ